MDVAGQSCNQVRGMCRSELIWISALVHSLTRLQSEKIKLSPEVESFADISANSFTVSSFLTLFLHFC